MKKKDFNRFPKMRSDGLANSKQAAQADRILASQLGGIGLCGRVICCSKWLKSAHELKVSIKMAKEQKLSLSPENLNGYCNHMKCCLSFEAKEEEIQKTFSNDENKENP